MPYASKNIGAKQLNLMVNFALRHLALLFEWVELHIAEIHLGSLGLKEYLSAHRRGIRPFIDELPIDVLLDFFSVGHQFQHIPLSMRLLHLSHRIAIPAHVLRSPFAKATVLHRIPRRSSDSRAILAGQGRSVCHPEIAGAPLHNLKLDRLWPDLLLALHVVEDAAIASLALAASIGSLSPLELRAQVKVLILLLRNDVTHLFARDMDHALLYLKHMIRIGVQPLALQKRVKVLEIRAIK